jgi:hypothetical protein
MGDRKPARDEEFQRFVIGRWPRLMRTAFLLTGEQHAAEDLVQTTLEQVYVAWRRVGAADDPEAYVRRVMINAHARKHRRRLKEFLAPTGDARHVYEPQRSDLARGTEHGKKWKVVIDVWGAPRNKAEAQGQLDAMTESGLGKPWVNVRNASELIGKSSYFVRLTLDGKTSIKLLGAFEKGDTMVGTDLKSGAMPLATSGTAASRTDQRLVIGQVATTAQEVTCTWDDGSTTKASRPAPGTGIVGDFEDAIRPADGSRSDWFVCVGPEGRTYEEVAVTK